MKFFNSYRGSRVTASKQVQSGFDKELLIPIDEIHQKLTGTFDFIACIRLLREKALIQTSGSNPVYVRGVLYDATGHMILLLWGDMIDTTAERKKIICIVLPSSH